MVGLCLIGTSNARETRSSTPDLERASSWKRRIMTGL